MKEIVLNLDFADGTYKSCEMPGEDLIVLINSWDDRIIKVTFHNTIGFIYKIGSFVSGLYEITNDPFQKEVLALYYENTPNNHPFKTFAIRDIEDSNFFEVVAERVSAIKV